MKHKKPSKIPILIPQSEGISLVYRIACKAANHSTKGKQGKVEGEG